jgi:hypothetical protein
MSGTLTWARRSFLSEAGVKEHGKLGVATSPQRQSGAHEPIREVSLVPARPFYRIQEATCLVTPPRWNLGRGVLLALGVGWVPLVILTLLFKSDTMGDLLKNYRVNVRMLIAVPVRLLGQVVMENVFRMIALHLREETPGFTSE